MIKNIIFDFDGVIVDSEVIVARSINKYLNNMGIEFEEKEFYALAGNKTFEVISILCSKYKISNKEKFYNDIMQISENLYKNELKAISGVFEFLQATNYFKLIGSNNIKERIIRGLKSLDLFQFFDENFIFTFDLVGIPKPKPDIYLHAIKSSKIDISETVIIEDSSIGTQAGVSAGIMVIGLTAGGHWYDNRSKKELYDAGAYEVVDNYDDMILLLNRL